MKILAILLFLVSCAQAKQTSALKADHLYVQGGKSFLKIKRDDGDYVPVTTEGLSFEAGYKITDIQNQMELFVFTGYAKHDKSRDPENPLVSTDILRIGSELSASFFGFSAGVQQSNYKNALIKDNTTPFLGMSLRFNHTNLLPWVGNLIPMLISFGHWTPFNVGGSKTFYDFILGTEMHFYAGLSDYTYGAIRFYY